ncbi:hypothetical protein [Paludibacterium paludis]|uniref:Uncharacterized protein n=1 Tax=Paludibacterium paludis TaxID=1225769 RepID=A0A918P5L1_9NEIS|nr:hypothetical protein [Paludibacterium paludis]GGY20025.1 hypothetical protein GCM10011289_24390 [Paludibacterium paludis]
MQRQETGSAAASLVVVLAAALAFGAGVWFVWRDWRLGAWLVNLLASLLLFAALGMWIGGRPDSVLIDNRNVISLSRLQMAAWSALILSALLTAAGLNMRIAPDAALNIALPEELLWLMGISASSLAGSALILNTKRSAAADPDLVRQTLGRTSSSDGADLTRQGVLVANASPREAHWSDLFTGEEVGNFSQLDLSRVQMFYISFLTVVVYGVMLGSLFASRHGFIDHFPAISGQLVGLIAISHGGYLAVKAVPHSQRGNPAGAGTPPDPPGN